MASHRLARYVKTGRNAAVVLCTILGSGALVAKAPAGAEKATHLYVSGTNDASYYTAYEAATTVSYPLAGGRIGPKPDRVYPKNTQGPMAVDAAGDLYASVANCSVAVYAPDSTKVIRSLNVGFGPSGCEGYFAYQNIESIALNDSGFLFVGMAWEYDGSAKDRAGPATRPASQSNDCYENACIFVYAPGASGDDAPLQIIAMGDPAGGMTTDREGNLYVRGNAGNIIVIAHPVLLPKQVRSITPSGFSGATNPIISEGALYVTVSKCAEDWWTCRPGIAVLPAGGNGVVVPDRYFLEPLNAYWFGYAIGGAGLYVGTGGSVVQAFDKHVQGEAMPLFSQILSPQPTYPSFMVAGR